MSSDADEPRALVRTRKHTNKPDACTYRSTASIVPNRRGFSRRVTRRTPIDLSHLGGRLRQGRKGQRELSLQRLAPAAPVACTGAGAVASSALPPLLPELGQTSLQPPGAFFGDALLRLQRLSISFPTLRDVSSSQPSQSSVMFGKGGYVCIIGPH